MGRDNSVLSRDPSVVQTVFRNWGIRMRHAFLIIAHDNFEQLKLLIQLLEAENHDIYVHIDKRNPSFVEEDFKHLTEKSNVHFYQEYKVFWGSFSLVQVELFLFEKAHPQKYDYYHLLSGMDLPLKSNTQIDNFFERHQGKEFIAYSNRDVKNDREIARRTKYYRFLQNHRYRYSQNWKNQFFTFWERVSIVLQAVCHINRVKDLDWTIKYGSQWVSITHELVGELLNNKEKITKVFSFTNCSDELFIQTIAFNCGFKDRLYHPDKDLAANLRYIDWSRSKDNHPYNF